jgi:hypothetical protein
MNKTAVPLILSSLQPISAFKRQNQAMSFVIRSLFSGYLDHILTTGLTIIFRQTSEANCSLISFEKYSIQRTASNLFSDNDPFLTSDSVNPLHSAIFAQGAALEQRICTQTAIYPSRSKG